MSLKGRGGCLCTCARLPILGGSQSAAMRVVGGPPSITSGPVTCEWKMQRRRRSPCLFGGQEWRTAAQISPLGREISQQEFANQPTPPALTHAQARYTQARLELDQCGPGQIPCMAELCRAHIRISGAARAVPLGKIAAKAKIQIQIQIHYANHST